MRRRSTTAAALLLAAALAAASCGDDPTLAGWEATWREAVGAVPALATVQSGDPGALCSETLGMLRQAAADLADAPNEDLAAAAFEWSAFAESVFLECPPAGGSHPGFEASYEEMARLASEVEALLAFEHQLRDG